MRWDAAPLQRKLLGGVWLLLPLCLEGHALWPGLGLFLLAAFFALHLPLPFYPYPRKRGRAALRIFPALSACFFLLAFFQHALIFAGNFFFSVSPLYETLALITALFFALPMGGHLLSRPIKNAPALGGGSAMLFIGLLIACR